MSDIYYVYWIAIIFYFVICVLEFISIEYWLWCVLIFSHSLRASLYTQFKEFFSYINIQLPEICTLFYFSNPPSILSFRDLSPNFRLSQIVKLSVLNLKDLPVDKICRPCALWRINLSWFFRLSFLFCWKFSWPVWDIVWILIVLWTCDIHWSR